MKKETHNALQREVEKRVKGLIGDLDKVFHAGAYTFDPEVSSESDSDATSPPPFEKKTSPDVEDIPMTVISESGVDVETIGTQ